MFSFKNLLLNTKCKHVFPCRYKRVFSVGTHAVTTYNPNTLEVTNQVILIEVVEGLCEPLKVKIAAHLPC
jgi:hypothetical protein